MGGDGRGRERRGGAWRHGTGGARSLVSRGDNGATPTALGSVRADPGRPAAYRFDPIVLALVSRGGAPRSRRRLWLRLAQN